MMSDESKAMDRIADAIFRLGDVLEGSSEGLHRIADQIRRLGTNDAMTSMGGLEALGAAIIEAADRIAAR